MTHSSSSFATWQKLDALAANPVRILDQFEDPGHLDRCSLSVAGIHGDFSKHQVNGEILDALVSLADEAGVLDRARAMYKGAEINTSEQRAALHMAQRKASDDLDKKRAEAIREQRVRMADLAEAIRGGHYKSATGEAFTDVINIGIGGSDLGPKMVCEALREFCDGPRVHFISNVDGAEILTLLKTLNASTTMLVISSKTFTTAETMLNAETALQWMKQELSIDKPQSTTHCIGITNSPAKANAFGIPAEQLLTFDEAIGGRYSVWSTIGFSVCVATGADSFAQFLAGGAAMDEHFLSAAPGSNLPLMMGMLAVWYNNFKKAQSHAVIPYCQRLGLLVAHLQQLDMESLGKSASSDGNKVDADTGAVIWGQTGTNGQHAFFQLLHQGTRLVPVDFIGVVDDPLSNQEHHRVLLANMIAQAEALMTGATGEDQHRFYEGNRPSTTLLLEKLDPSTLGALVALYEHRVFVQSCIWQVNPFDQWGVELGKSLANNILAGSGSHDPSTAALLRRTGLDA